MPWTEAEIGDQNGKTVIVTGGTSGLGFATAKALAAAGARVLIASHNPARGQLACDRLRALHPDAAFGFAPLDLGDLESVRTFAAAVGGTAIDILINNAGIVRVPERLTTASGFEMQFATNYLGHFALTGLLLPLLKKSAAARVVSVSSLEHRKGRIDFEDLQAERRYEPSRAYRQSKLAMLLFARELQRRSQAVGLALTSIAAHPGASRTNIFRDGPRRGGRPDLETRLVGTFVEVFGQSAEQGALPILYAATAPAAEGGAYYGPGGWQELRGYPAPARVAPPGRDLATAERLWQVSETLTGVTYDFGAPAG